MYFERILKNSKSSVWMRNIQMGFSSIGLALGGVYFSGVTTITYIIFNLSIFTNILG